MSAVSTPDPLVSMLERIRRSFYVRAAQLRLMDDEDGPIELSAGAPIAWAVSAAVHRLQRLAATETVIVPDVDREADLPGETRDGPRIRFFAGIPLLSDKGKVFGVLSLYHSNPRWLTNAHVRAFEDLAAELAPLAQCRRDAVTIARLKHRIERQAETFARSRDTFERAAIGARVGLWECALHDESLTWSGQVYDMFGIARGSRLVRQQSLECYASASRGLLERIRREALERRQGFQLDAEINATSGASRWIRISASVDCRGERPIRLFGMKQDITEQKLLLDQTRFLAQRDAMTGLANRTQFEERFATLSGDLAGQPPIEALILVDLDGFKQVNDGYGHAAGDACLKESALRLSAICAQAELVARIGGDEFAILLGPTFERDAIDALGQEIVAALGQPMAGVGLVLQVGASVGIAHVDPPCTPSDLFTQADIALYAAKAAGRGTVRTFVGGMGSDSERRMPWPIAHSAEHFGSTQQTTH
ncbi:diguanylate cyclase [Methylobacterium sp. C25]|uniref:diguanylate cyclase domain-containing protein n=1 Tax=Methylobacterium sp. C25 TaxID=2721622 RepID=UPI001F3A96D9|nr:diguanylate cyclase [Methylobacterium sp. C25]MCE4224032.1 diguanylate cyclase [Methylobacterium sp. C25]